MDWFLPAIVLAVVLAYYMPQAGITKEPVSLSQLANYGISGIFFFYGLKLNREKLIKGLGNWQLHVFIQAVTFVVFPLIIMALKPFFKTDDPIWLGLFFLSTLPSTVSSSVVMVSLAGGNIPAAIFNASISAFIGIIVTPLWLGLYLENSQINFEIGTVVLKLSFQVLIPIMLGLLLNKKMGHFAEKHKNTLKTFDQLVILLIIYTSFCKSFSDNLFNNLTFLELIFLVAGLMFLFLCILIFCKLIAKFLKFNVADTITLMFCGSKKSLVHGTVMTGILFSGNPISGYILLPIMLYHAQQLIASSILAKRIALKP